LEIKTANITEVKTAITTPEKMLVMAIAPTDRIFQESVVGEVKLES